MKIKTYTVLTLVVFSSAAFAWQPVVYPIRSQSPYQRSIDNATCFATANKQTKINIAHESQIPPRHPPVGKTTSTGAPSRPPLPPSTFSATPPGVGMPAGASAAGASAPVATAAAGASAATAGTATHTGKAANPPGTNATTAANAASGTAATAGAPASDAMTMAANPASAPSADGGATDMAGASGVKLPPLPAPEPPMTQYWAAYGACMQARGYVVQ
ncbi:hypothetical protein LFL96_03485 [Paraburkholderia sp. D15]|uniref:hypothetical protein n=1 Tax=Paraburkholderia sp. D15 TaxID=2880218 RepID=UPI0024789A5F|nr:hypothetical protein [Paraburkholderia sp. D15]WGS50584.1 hypothetical protein LFL96_03485 [Paraburkholderia sp. D15]